MAKPVANAANAHIANVLAGGTWLIILRIMVSFSWEMPN
jgi:hypothetical protein